VSAETGTTENQLTLGLEEGQMGLFYPVAKKPLNAQVVPNVDNSFSLIPSREYTEGVDSIVVYKPELPYSTAPRPGRPLVILTDAQREQVDAPSVRMDKERTRFLDEVTQVITQPYADLFAGMVPVKKRRLYEGDLKQTIERRDKLLFADIFFAINTKVAYFSSQTGNALEKAELSFDNNVGNAPRLEMVFNGRRMSEINLRFDFSEQRVLKMLVEGSFLGRFLEQFTRNLPKNDDEWHHFLLNLQLGKKSASTVLVSGRPYRESYRHERLFTWDPRQKFFKDFKAVGNTPRPRLLQSEFVQLLWDMLALIPASEQGSFDRDRVQRIRDLRFKEVGDIIREVEESDIPSGEQFGAVLKALDEDGRKVYLTMGLLPETPILSKDPDKA
jgi:hypothetical protein